MAKGEEDCSGNTRTQPTIPESIEIEIRKVTQRLINDRASWELPPAWKYALASEMDKDRSKRREWIDEEVTV